MATTTTPEYSPAVSPYHLSLANLYEPRQPRISPPDTRLKVHSNLGEGVKKMPRPLYDFNIRLHVSGSQRVDGAHALLPRNHVIGSSMDQKGRGTIGTAEDLGVGGDGYDLRLSWGSSVGGWTIKEKRDGLRAPVHVQYEAPTRICERHEHAGMSSVGGRVIVCDLGAQWRLVWTHVL